MSKHIVWALLVVAGSGVARADEPSAPIVDVADLPPLPAAEEAPVSSATVLAASSASEDVVVGAAKREQSLGNVASAVTVISGDRIRRFGYRTLGEAIAGVAGAYLVDDRLAYSIGIRGLQIPGDFNTRLLVLIDGASVNEAWGAFAGLGYEAMVSIDEVARIEVIRGPVSSFYGTNAFFGTINIVTRGAAENRGVWATAAVNTVNGPTASAGFTIGDVGHQLRGNVHFMNRIGDTNHVADISDQALSDDASYAIGGGLSGQYGGSFAQVRAYRYSRQSPFAPYNVDPTGRPYELHDTQLMVEGGHTHQFSDRLSLTGRLYGNFYQYDDDAPPPLPAPGFITVGTAQTGGVEARARYELLESGKLGVTAGTEASVNNTVSRAHDEGAPDEFHIGYRYENDGTYAELDAEPTTWFGATAGVRYDVHYDALTDFRTKLSPRVALFLSNPEHYGLKLLYTEGFRAASAFESQFNDGADFIDNPKIEPEEIRSYEAILWARPVPGLSLRLSGFHWTVSKFIEQETVVDPDPEINGRQQFQNGGKLRSMGVEAEGTYRDSRGWYAFGGFAYSRVGETQLDAATGTFGSDFVYGQTVNAPAITASGGVSSPKLFGRVHVSTELNYIGSRKTRAQSDGSESPDDPAWVGWNATLYAPGIAGFDVTAGVRNLIGTRDLVPTPGDYDRMQPDNSNKVIARIPGEGREFYVKVGYAY